jgi:hypothetical protein
MIRSTRGYLSLAHSQTFNALLTGFHTLQWQVNLPLSPCTFTQTSILILGFKPFILSFLNPELPRYFCLLSNCSPGTGSPQLLDILWHGTYLFRLKPPGLPRRPRRDSLFVLPSLPRTRRLLARAYRPQALWERYSSRHSPGYLHYGSS